MQNLERRQGDQGKWWVINKDPRTKESTSEENEAIRIGNNRSKI